MRSSARFPRHSASGQTTQAPTIAPPQHRARLAALQLPRTISHLAFLPFCHAVTVNDFLDIVSSRFTRISGSSAPGCLPLVLATRYRAWTVVVSVRVSFAPVLHLLVDTRGRRKLGRLSLGIRRTSMSRKPNGRSEAARHPFSSTTAITRFSLASVRFTRALVFYPSQAPPNGSLYRNQTGLLSSKIRTGGMGSPT
ncbi:hypothetical protein BJ322DRAFT_293610 [Thelephora terrestris]|uniref:Uncharacterized protein n=1 Tax=Thelephora terrestris TaxID=56493 RepID=A0A9P6H6Q0_9AGAM|nr:hypothetical protein BJ322DRAFT_293610 [Thelephora terrestris]